MFSFEEDGFGFRKECGGYCSFLERRAHHEFLTRSY